MDPKGKFEQSGEKAWHHSGHGLLITITVLFVIAAAGAGTFYYKYHQLKTTPSVAASSETTKLTGEVGKLLALPTGETPTVATVTDPAKLKDQAFFASTIKGDKLLIYTSAKKAIIYRPSTNKIINVGPIAINSATDTTSK
jgi:hypothetical protein